MTNDIVMPRENATVGEKLYSYCTSMGYEQKDLLKPMVAFAATNGEMTSSADKEFTDAKLNDKRVEAYILPFVATASQQMQIDKYNTVYQKYIFITRWRCFNHFNFNRILPNEDFDEKIRRDMVYADEQAAKQKKEKDEPVTFEDAMKKQRTNDGRVYMPRTSSLLLWALCPEDTSSDWFRLFDSDFFVEAYNDKETYRSILNTND